ncbi:MAG: pentapeptide repeat-containing protein [Phycisphaerales bacterium]
MTEPRQERIHEPAPPPDAQWPPPRRKVSREELDKRLLAHIKWLKSEKKEGARFRSGEREDLSGERMPGVNLSGALLWFADLNGADLEKAELGGGDLVGANLSGANLQKANLSGTRLIGVSLREADLREAELSGAELFEANLSGADLRLANVASANLRKTQLFRTRGLYGPDRATSLGVVKGAEHAVYGHKHDFAHWALLRFLGTLHLFSASYIAFVAITVYATALRWHNQHVPIWHAWAREHDSWSDGLVRFFAGLVLRIPELPVQRHFGILLVAIGLLALATTLHALFCPEAIKEATETRWTRELNQPLIEYRSAMYHRFWVRYITLISFGLGGLYTLGYLLWRASRALWYLLTV